MGFISEEIYINSCAQQCNRSVSVGINSVKSISITFSKYFFNIMKFVLYILIFCCNNYVIKSIIILNGISINTK